MTASRPSAVFPVALVLASLRARGFDHDLSGQFGYSRAKKMRPAVRYHERDLSFVHCGRLPLIATVSIWYSLRAFNTGRTCYINTEGEHIYPA